MSDIKRFMDYEIPVNQISVSNSNGDTITCFQNENGTYLIGMCGCDNERNSYTIVLRGQEKDKRFVSFSPSKRDGQAILARMINGSSNLTKHLDKMVFEHLK